MKNLSYKTLFIIFFFLLIGVVVLSKFVFPNQKVSAAWWNDMWNYRKAISISNTSGSNLTDFQVSLSVGTSALIASGKMQSDCDDIRITDQNGNLLPHWIEENNPGCNQIADTKIWIKTSSLPTSGATVYIYYGNSSANNNENGNNVFLEFDDFKNPSTINNWILESNPSTTYSISGGTMSAIASSGDYSSAVFGSNYTDVIVNSRFKVNTAQSHGGFIFRGQSVAADNSYQWLIREGLVDNRIQKRSGGGQYYLLGGTSGTALPSNFFADIWYPIEFRLSGTQVDTYFDNQQAINGNFADTSFASGKIGILSYDGSEYFDYIFVRKYASTDPIPTLQSEEVGTGPIAYWKFDEGVGTSVYDSSSKGHNGTLQNGTSWASEDQCVSGKCLKFDGVDDYVNAGTGTNYLPMDTFSMCAWAKSPGLASGMTFNGIMSYTYGLTMYIDGSGNFVSRVDNGTNIISVAETSQSLYDNKFHHLCFTFDGTNRKMYIDGNLKKTTATTWNNRYTTNSVNIGHENNSSSIYKFNGWIDEPKIYNYSRTADQIKLDYNAGKAHAGTSEGTATSLGSNNKNNYLSDGLVGYWKMDEGVGTTTLDSSGNGKTATISGAIWSSGKYGVGLSFVPTSYLSIGSSVLSNATVWSVNTQINYINQSKNFEFFLGINGGNSSGGKILLRHNGYVSFFGSNNTYYDFSTTSTEIQDTSKNISFISDGTKISLYVDGIFKSSVTPSSTSISINSIANAWSDTAWTTNCVIDELRIYNRALSPTEVTQLYNYAPGPVGYWDFNEGSGTSVTDKSGNNNTGTWSGSGSHWAQGKIGGAGNFNGTNNVVLVSDTNNSLDLPYDFTISFWANPTSSGTKELIAKAHHGNYEFYQSDTSLIVRINGDSSAITASNFFTYGQWTYITIKYERSTGLVNVYKDGNYFTSGTNTNSAVINNSSTQIGAYYDGTSYPFLGKIDDVKIYNYARTQKQIIEDMTGGASAVSSKSMLAHYKFDEGSGTIVYNSGIGGTALNGTFGVGDSAPSWSNEGKNNKALNFNGNDSITLSNEIVSTSSIRENGITYSAWIKPSNISGTQKIVGQKPSSGYSNLASGGLDISSGKARMIAYDDGGVTYKYATGNTSLSVNQWYLITGIYNPLSKTIKIYVNGKLDGGETSIITFSRLLTNSYNLIGSHNSTAAFFNGLIDEVKIYNYALTDEEVKQDYNQGSAIQMGSTTQTIGGTTTSLEYCIPGDTSYCAAPVAEWKMDEGTGTSIVDTSGNNYTSTFIGSPNWAQGKIGKSIEFNGSNNAIQLSGPSTSSHETLSTWVYIDSSSPNGDIVGNCHTNSNQYGFTLYLDGNYLRAKAETNSDTYFYTNVYYDISSLKNKWLYASMVWDNLGTGTGGCDANVKLYVNGQLVSESTHNVSSGSYNCTYPYSYPFSMGGTATNSLTRTTKVKLDQTRVYNYARTPAQIAYDYNKGAPVGWWKMDECEGSTVYDWSGNQNNGTITIGASGTQNSLGTCAIGTSAAWTSGATGKINSSLNFDGYDDRITIGNPTSLQIAGTKNFSVAAWIYSNQNKCGREAIDKSSNTLCGLDTRGGWVLGGKTGTLGFLVSDSTNTQYRYINFNSQLNIWYHLVGIRNGNNLYLYVNGKLNQTADVTGFIIDDNNNLSIGGNNVNNWLWPGQIDDVRIYNYALTSEQVKILYNGGSVSFN